MSHFNEFWSKWTNWVPCLTVALVLGGAATLFAYDWVRPLDSTVWNATGLGIKDGEIPAGLLDDLYDRRLEKFADDRRAILTNLKWQAILVVFTIAVFWHYDRKTPGANKSDGKGKTDKSSSQIEVWGFKIQRAMLPLIKITLPVVVMYIWFQFGYLLVGLIENRRILEEIIELREAGLINHDGLLSARRLLGDGFILDSWFGAFETQRHADFLLKSDVFVPSWFKIISYSVFLGVAHASALLPVCMVMRELKKQHWLKAGACVYLALLLGSLLATHLEFRFAYHNPNWGQPIILLTATALVLLALMIPRSKGKPIP